MSRPWRDALRDWTDARLLTVLVLGFSSGLPLVLTLSTLSTWLKDVGVDKSTIGLFALVGLPYTLKFLWAPLLDRVAVPLLGRMLGRRRSWGLVTQAGLMVSIFGLGFSDPAQDAGRTAAWALAVAFFSASQDVVVDAFRVELMGPQRQGVGASAIQIGYRIGMLAGGAGALFLADRRDWPIVYAVMALLVAVGMATLLVTPEPVGRHAAGLDEPFRWLRWIESAVIRPLLDFTRNPGWLAILFFVVFYKLGDAMLGMMANPFYLEIGFSKSEIAAISKVFGLSMTLAGVALGGVMVSRFGMLRSLLVCGVAQALSNLMFSVQAVAGHDRPLLMATIAVENLAGGMASTAFVAYLSSLCNVAYTATQYALLSALASIGRTVFSSTSGFLADNTSWVAFFVVSTVAAMPGLVLLVWMMRRWPPRAGGDPATESTDTLPPNRWLLEDAAGRLLTLEPEPPLRDPVRLPVLTAGKHVHEPRHGEWWRKPAAPPDAGARARGRDET